MASISEEREERLFYCGDVDKAPKAFDKAIELSLKTC